MRPGSGGADSWFLFFVLGCAAVLLLPVPTVLLDLLLVLNLVVALGVLFLATSISRPREFLVFPSLLILLSGIRVLLNLCSTRLILQQGGSFDGVVIRTFGEYVLSGSYLVGGVVFLIMLAFQYLVVNKGAERIAEVSARFMLDGMQVKQLGIENRLEQGLIDAEEAAELHERLDMEMRFYGSMDGASKYIQGETMLSFVIVGINILGGVFKGLSEGMGLSEALHTYVVLTIGDGMSGAIPSVLVSLAAAIVISRNREGVSLGEDIRLQLLENPSAVAMALGVGGGVSLLLALAGGGWTVFLPLSLVLFLASRRVGAMKPVERGHGPAAAGRERGSRCVLRLERRFYDSLDLDELTEAARKMRLELEGMLGFDPGDLLPVPDAAMESDSYRFEFRGDSVGEGYLPADRVLVMRRRFEGEALDSPPGHPAFLPWFEGEAYWVEPAVASELVSRGWSVRSRELLLCEWWRRLALEIPEVLFSLQDVDAMLSSLARTAPAVRRQLSEAGLEPVLLYEVLTLALQEGVRISDVERVFELLARAARLSKDPVELLESLRRGLARSICASLCAADRTLVVAVLDDEWRRILEDSIVTDADGARRLSLDTGLAMSLFRRIGELVSAFTARGLTPVLLVPRSLRFHLSRLLRARFRELYVISPPELADEYRTRELFVVEGEAGAMERNAEDVPA